MAWIPRSGLDVSYDVVWLPRLIDKARRQASASTPETDVMNGYLYGDNDFVDAQVLRFLRTDDASVTALVRERPNDDDVARILVARSGRTAEERIAYSTALRRKMMNFALMEADELRMPSGLKRTLIRFVYNRLMMPIVYVVFRRAERRRASRRPAA